MLHTVIRLSISPEERLISRAVSMMQQNRLPSTHAVEFPDHGPSRTAKDLDEWLAYYNNERTHQGKMCCGRTPMATHH